MSQMLGLIAEFERSIIQECVEAGLATINAELSLDCKIAQAVRRALKGSSVMAAAVEFGIGLATVQRIKQAA